MTSKLDDDRVSFLDLPPELRNVVYSHCLTLQDDWLVIEKLWERTSRKSKFAADPFVQSELTVAVLSTCRTINSEASPILYGTNFFVFDFKAAVPFLRTVESHRNHIRKIHIDTNPPKSLTSALNMLKTSPQIEVVEISSYLLLDQPAAKTAKLVGPFFRAIHKQRKGTDKKAAMDVLTFQEADDEWSKSEKDEYDAKGIEIKAILQATLK